jgi:hypothetical protein
VVVGADFQALRARGDAPSRQVRAARWIAQTSWPRFAARAHHGHGRILVGLEALQRVEDEASFTA